MNKQLNLIRYIASAGLMVASISLAAAESKPSTLLYISPTDYNYSVRLLHPYYDYWFTQGPLVEPIALKALHESDAELKLCKANETADRIVRIKPQIFYNPQLRVYHSKLEATIYSGGGSVLGTYSGEGQQLGFTSFNHAINLHLSKAYSSAMIDLMTKLDMHQNMQSNTTETKLPCGLIGASQAEPKVNFY